MTTSQLPPSPEKKDQDLGVKEAIPKQATLSDWQDADFTHSTDAAELQGPYPLSTILLITISAFFALAITWASIAEIDELTRGEGKIIPSSQNQVVQYSELGIVKSIHVQENARVEKGQILFVVEDTAAKASLGELQAVRYAIMGKIARLTAEALGTPLQFPPEMENAKQVAEAEERQYRTRQESLQAQVATLYSQVDQRKQELAELEGKLEQSRASLALAEQELGITAPLVEKRIVPQINLLRLQREINDLQGQISASELAKPRIESTLAEANQKIAERYLLFKAEAGNDLNAAHAELAGKDEAIKALTDRVMRTEILSPASGIIKNLHVHTVNSVIKPGDTLAEVVPVDDTLLVEVKIKPTDIAFVHAPLMIDGQEVSQRAIVKVSAYDFSIYGGLPGQVIEVSPDSFVDETSGSRNPETFYKAIIKTDRNYLERYGEKNYIKPGMPVTADIKTGQKSILTYLLKPFFKTKERALRER